MPNNSYGTKGGNSMATPHVTGLAGLIKANNPSTDWRQIRNLILSTGDNLTAMSGKTLTGKRVNAHNAPGQVNLINRVVDGYTSIVEIRGQA
jgi:subtilisin family serine protease